MSDNKLNECRQERDRLRVKVQGLEKLLDMPEHKAVKTLHYERRRDHELVEKLKQKLSRLKTANGDLHSQIDPLRQTLKTEKSRTELFESQLQEIREWLRDNGHPVVMGESIVEKLVNMQTIINSNAAMMAVLNHVLKERPEVAAIFKEELENAKSDPNPLGLASKIGGA